MHDVMACLCGVVWLGMGLSRRAGWFTNASRDVYYPLCLLPGLERAPLDATVRYGLSCPS